MQILRAFIALVLYIIFYSITIVFNALVLYNIFYFMTVNKTENKTSKKHNINRKKHKGEL